MPPHDPALSRLLRIPAAGAARQRGVIILLTMLLALAASSYVVLKALNSRPPAQTAERIETRRVLQRAKLALIGYALNYASDDHAANKGPGHLPCPDHDAAGTVGSSDTVPDCTEDSGNETGRYPWRTLGMDDLRDASGAPLWYAVSSNYRSMRAPPLNSETPGTLVVGNTADVVAVIIAPGPELEGQSRTAQHAYDAAAFLEGNNAITGKNATGVAAFDRHGAVPFNDQLVYITRAELMAAIEQRVINEVANALEDYFHDPDGDDVGGFDQDCLAESLAADCDDGFPWLVDAGTPPPAWASPPIAYIAGTPDVAFGYVPLVYLGDGAEFDADFRLEWSIATAGDYVPAAGADAVPPPESCLRSSAACEVPGLPGVMIDDPVSGQAGGPWSQGVCSLPATGGLSCMATYTYGTSLRRTYRFDFGGDVRLQPAAAGHGRTMGVQAVDTWPGGEALLTVTDYDAVDGTEIGSATLAITALDAGDLVRLSIPFDLQVRQADAAGPRAAPGDLPLWFYVNNWHQLVIVQYGEGEAPGHPAATCVDPPSTCLTLNLLKPASAPPRVTTAVRGLVLSAGSALPLLGQTRPSGAWDAYLEAKDTDDPALFNWREVAADFNDQLVILDPQQHE